MENNQEGVYSRHVVEFVTVANEYCKYSEHAGEIKGQALLTIFQRFLPLLYLKATFLPKLEPLFEDGNEKFVTEFDWYRIHDSFLRKLGSADDYLKLPDEVQEKNEGPVPGSLSEDFADIYQDMKNFILLYQTGTEEVMNDAIWECKMNFDEFWGKKLLNAIRAIHIWLSAGEIADDTSFPEGDGEAGRENRIIKELQKEYHKRGGENISQ